MKNLPGVTRARKKDGTVYYRSSITIQSKHISLGSFDSANKAGQAYREASQIIRDRKYQLDDYSDSFALDFTKFVILLNFRNSGIYFKTPIYLQSGFFYYYLSPDHFLIFDREDLFFYANHKLQTRGGYYFICDYGSQYNILSRYGIKNYARKGIDYIFVNQNEYDFRYENIKVINEYMGVSKISREGQVLYECVIHIRGNYLIGRYQDKHIAAVAYNKAVDLLAANGIDKKYIKNYIHAYSPAQYHQIYEKISIPDKIRDYTQK
ncbi:MAG: hypothetical protein K2K56_00970 [Lachnospiraceae bacterium]|nr:hypothetical protein [Lachnospiraceae bacterium]